MERPAVALLVVVSVCFAFTGQPLKPSTQSREAYFNGSAYIRMLNTISFHSHVGISFRSCIGGELFIQRYNSHSVQLTALPDYVLLSFKAWNQRSIEVSLPLRPLDNRWHYVGIVYRSPNLIMSDESGHSVIVANNTYNSEVLSTPEYENETAILIVGNAFHGCMMEGPSLVFNASLVTPHNVEFKECPIDKCLDGKHSFLVPPTNHCYHEPCMRHGKCVSRADRYECHCAARYAGNNCQIDNGPQCKLKICQNGGKCEETLEGDYTCECNEGFYGQHCEIEVSKHPLCIKSPCLNNGTCQVPNDESYECTCLPGFTGVNCETNIDDCQTSPCQNGGICQDGINNYTCICTNTGYTGDHCEININECDLQPGPCLNDGVCFDTYGSYVCHCQPGYAGNNCQLNQNECLSSPCLNGGTCEDLVGSYRCNCPRETAGQRCTLRRSVKCVDTECPPHSTCADYSASTAMCVCDPGYQGTPGPTPNCTLMLTSECPTNHCANGGTCTFNIIENNFNCTCPPGFSGMYCERSLISMSMPEYGLSPRSGMFIQCADQPCINSISCKDYPGGYFCQCEPGWTGNNCDTDVNECLPNSCQNGGECINLINAFHCRCPFGFNGRTCQNVEDICKDNSCKNGGSCVHIKNNTDFVCECSLGFEGIHCEHNIDDCIGVVCPDHQICFDEINSYACRCPDGLTGENCSIPTDFCSNNPCVNGVCSEGGNGKNYTCNCNKGYTGYNCDIDIDECNITGICNQGICVNKPGSYQCYCKPGFTGEHCNIDFDECLSKPCKNGGSCINKIDDFDCVCAPGFTGKDCSIDINECESNPCMEGSTCINGKATFTCICSEGLTGSKCEINIDDCESHPCLNGGICEDGLNNYTCNCTDTGHRGPQCEHNIDDCASNPCIHGSTCHDLIKDYECICHPGYSGKNCEIDDRECDSNPCQHHGICLERSNVSLYQNTSFDQHNPVYYDEDQKILLPINFYQEFSYSNASGFVCICIDGITGDFCEIDINECDPSPCGPWGKCIDKIGRYECECENGFEGDHCQKDIDECDRYKPCIKGVCHDRRANYYCECEPGWGGKNCSVALQGCATNECLNGGTCLPWLFSETEHRFNCTCNPGYHGNTCEKITTMSLGGHGYVVVNTTRDEGHDIQFRFKTTLGNGLLAMGKGFTFYILELVNGRLNLRSSLLNKWEGVFIGSGLNDTKWQKVFVAINSSHVVLAANEEQTIYPISLNEGSNGSFTSFPTTYLGGTISELRRLAHGPAAFIGCVEDVVINGEWVLPNDMPMDSDDVSMESSRNIDFSSPIALSSQFASWLLYRVQIRCPRKAQCGPKNPCHSGGKCTDLWTSFHCSCQRPYLGHTCQYNVTAATFGHENITNSLVTVMVSDNARRAVRSIVDISMFIRTRKPSGQIFYLGSKPRGELSLEEIYVAASLGNGELFVHLQFNQTTEAYAVGGNRLDNGFNHLIQIVRNSTLVQVKLNGSEYFRKPISAAGQLDAQVLYLGGQPILTPSRAIRQADVSLSNGVGTSSLVVIHRNLRTETVTPYSLSADYFKGIIQDVQISNGSRTMIVEFFPLNVTDLEMPIPFGIVSFDNNTVLEGVVSDDSCASNPCHHNGTCQITWNDYKCTCSRGYKGKSCQEIEFCQLQNCPLGSTCHNLNDGYECIANATFDGHNTSLAYNITLIDGFIEEEKPLRADSISIEYRSKTGGTLLHIENPDNGEMMSISVFRDQVTVSWRLSPLRISKVTRFRKSQPDFLWTRIHLIISRNHIRGGFGDWQKEDSPSFTSEFDRAAWIDLLKTGEIYLGGVRSFKQNEIELSMVTIPSLTDIYSLKNNSRFEKQRSLHIRSFHTVGREQYDGDILSTNNVDLLNMPAESETQDPDSLEFWMGSEGKIGEKFKGCLGEVRIGDFLLPFYTLSEIYPKSDSLQPGHYYFSLQTERENSTAIGCTLCFNNDCLNGGHCAEPSNSYACMCPVGFTGDDCAIDINECINSTCQNNSTCVDGIGNYTCICQSGWEGWLCDVDIDECASQPCLNSGTCTDLPGRFYCICPEEFTGPLCSSPRLLTCAHHPCRAGATCHDQKDPITENNFTCSCMPGFEGVFCDTPYCVVKPCINGGICESLPESVPTCKCPPGFIGKYCEINIDECKMQNGISPCLHGGHCIDGIASYTCDCYNTGYVGVNCEEDIDECLENNMLCGDGGTCVNTNGSYECLCGPEKCGNNCSLMDPCSEVRYINSISDDIVSDIAENSAMKKYSNTTENYSSIRGPCENGGTCKPKCKVLPDYNCHCINGWGGKNCTMRSVEAAQDENAPIGIIIGGVVGGLCALGAIGLVVACMLARSKRATRGTYSPSGQEYRNPRLEMLDSLKPPPEERLI